MNASAQIPAVGSSKRIDVGCWNLNWLGHTQNGPVNNALQLSRVLEVLEESRIDLWALEEVCDTAALAGGLRQQGHWDYRFSAYWQEQKMALVWDSREWMSVADSQLFKAHSADFAAGRWPLLSVLRSRTGSDTLMIVAVHLKAHTGNSGEQIQAWENRRKSVEHLLRWAREHEERNLVIMGDWNDDVDSSLLTDSSSSIITLDSAGYFLTTELSLLGENTWLSGTACIDHIWLNDRLMERYRPGSTRRFLLDRYLDQYRTTVSDHYPVYAALDYPIIHSQSGTEHRVPAAYPNPCYGSFRLSREYCSGRLTLVDSYGRMHFITGMEEEDTYLFHWPAEGVYILRVESKGFHYALCLVVTG